MQVTDEPTYKSEKGQPNGISSLDGSGTIPLAQIPNSIKGGIKVIGFWDASTNTPDLSALTLLQGQAYQVSVAGNTNLNGTTNWKQFDLAVWDDVLAGNWFKIDNTDAVISVFGRTGAITSQNGDYTASQVTNAFDKVADDTDDIIEGIVNRFNANHTGEVTGSGALTITANAVTNGKLAQVPTATFKGRATALTGNVEDLTPAQATALLDQFTSLLKGIVPASGGGIVNFLRADGTWASPPSPIWQPPTVEIGAGINNGINTSVNTAGAGFNKWFTGTGTAGKILFNIPLFNNGLNYDGSGIRLNILWQLFSANGGGNVPFQVTYKFVKSNGTVNAESGATVSTATINVTGRTPDRLFKDELLIFNGTAGDSMLMITLQRNTGGGLNSNIADLIGIQLNR